MRLQFVSDRSCCIDICSSNTSIVSVFHSEGESKDRALQQRVRRLHSKLEKSATGVVADVKDVKPAAAVVPAKDFAAHIPLGLKACDFLTKSTDPFLAVKTCTDALDAAGFVKLSKRDPFAGVLKPGGSYYYTTNHSTLVAFNVGHKFKGGNGFKIIGGHTGKFIRVLMCLSIIRHT